ncbi:OmpA family protein [Ignatzschineria sp. LJL83]
MFKLMLKMVAAICLGSIVAACSTTGSSNSSNLDGMNSGYASGPNSTYYDVDYGKRGTVDRIIYFDFDSDRLRTESYDVVTAHGQELKRNPNRGVWLEGHTDDRGSHEYNMGLAERRANSVKALLLQSGANPNQIKVRSYGKEMPAVSGYDERAWAQNRRVEIIY